MSEEITTVERLYDVLVQPWSGQHVSCHLVVGPLLSAPGSLYLEADQLRFRRSSGLSGRLAPAKDIIISLLEVSHIQFSQADVGVTLKGGKTLWFRGKLLVYIVGWLYALGMPAEPTAGEWSLRSGKGILTTTYSSGLLQRHGVLAVGEDMMVFLPLGSIDLSLGSWPLCIPLQDLLKIEESSGTITVSSAAEEWSFLNAKTKQLMVPLSAALCVIYCTEQCPIAAEADRSRFLQPGATGLPAAPPAATAPRPLLRPRRTRRDRRPQPAAPPEDARMPPERLSAPAPIPAVDVTPAARAPQPKAV